MSVSLNLPPAFVDRKREISHLDKFVENVFSGAGSVLLIQGEGGVGKTRLLEEVKRMAGEKGFYVLPSKCLPGTTSPLSPFYEALKFVNLEHLLVESSPNLDALYVVNKGGIILSKYEKTVKNIDPDIFLGMVTAVENFIRDSMTQIAGKEQVEIEEKLGVMRHGEFTIVNMPGKNINLVALVEGVENEYLLDDMGRLIERIEAISDASEGMHAELEEMLRALVESDKYTRIALETVDRRTGIFENVLLGIKRISSRKPVLLVIDDLQWADSSSLSLLNYIGRDIAAERVGIICAARSDEIPTASMLPDMIDAMRTENILELLNLAPLDRGGVEELIERVLGGHVDAGFKERVYIEAEGNPLFVIELLKYLTDKGLLRREAELWVYEKEEIRIPERIYEIIKEKITRLNADEFEVLETASVLGTEFITSLLEKMVDMDRIKLLRALSRIEKIHGLIKQEGGKYRFDPTKIRDVIYDEMGSELRQALHEMVGKILEEEYKKGDEEKILGAIYHYRKAGCLDKLKDYGLVVADKLAGRFAYDEAVEVLKALYNSLNRHDLKEKEIAMAALEKMIEVLLSSGLYEDAMKALEEKISQSGDGDDKAVQTHVTRSEIYLKMGEHEKAMESINRAFELLARTRGTCAPEIARMLSIKGYIHERAGNYQNAIECQEKALELFSKERKEKEIATCYTRIGSTHYYLGNYDECIACLRIAEEIFARNNDKYGLSQVYNNLGMVYYELEDFRNAERYLEKTVELKETVHDMAGIAIAKNNLGNVHFEMGNLEKAIGLYIEARRLCKKTGDKWMFVYNQIDLAEAFAEKGDEIKFRSAIEEALNVASQIGMEKEVVEAKEEMEKRFRR
ncbi:MAG: tetratricopeptide repeat protein [Thermoplasmata archaeon]|nr:tetratricopeptide repeat protein [Thermoplasmata archaeon]